MTKQFAPTITPRKLMVKFKPIKDWHPKGCWYTYHFNAMSILTPLLEYMVIATIRKATSQVNDPILQQEINSLLQQEANHSNTFVQFNRTCIAPFYGKNILKFRFGAWRVLIAALPFSCKLAASAFGEHLATVGSELLLKEPIWLDRVEPAIALAWQWHSIEEIEHKAVAFNVYCYFNKNYFVRVGAMLLFLSVFLWHYFQLILYMIKKDKKSLIKSFIAYNYFLWGKPGLFRKLWCPIFSYMKFCFHPNKKSHAHIIKPSFLS